MWMRSCKEIISWIRQRKKQGSLEEWQKFQISPSEQKGVGLTWMHWFEMEIDYS